MTQEFGQALRSLRLQSGLPLIEVARRANIARSHLYRLEAGEIGEPNRATLEAVALALGVTPEELFEVAWQTMGSGPGLPSLRTFFGAKYGLTAEQIDKVEQALQMNLPQPVPTTEAST